mmetsp:Transcript_3829/g.8809  ORF Transcript_3829/g.8809 Transcript_3829/m.8809 type:complete len:287 (+) Transcript_3829:44-904(+)
MPRTARYRAPPKCSSSPPASNVARRKLDRRSGRLLLQLSDLLGRVVELLDQRLHLLVREPLDGLVLPHHHHFDVLAGRLRHLEQALERQPNSRVFVQVLGVLLLKEVNDAFRILADGGGLPCVVGAGGVGLVQGRLPLAVEATDEGRDAEGAHAAPVRVLLLRPRDETGHVVHRWAVFDVEAVRLALNARLVHKNPGVCVQACECEGHAVVDCQDLADRAGVLQLGRRPLLDRQDHAVLALHAHGRRSLADGLEGILHLEQVPIGGEDGDRAVVAGHGSGGLCSEG